MVPVASRPLILSQRPLKRTWTPPFVSRGNRLSSAACRRILLIKEVLTPKNSSRLRTIAERQMLRWVAAGVLEAVSAFRRLKGYTDMPKLAAALRAHDQQFGSGRNSHMRLRHMSQSVVASQRHIPNRSALAGRHNNWQGMARRSRLRMRSPRHEICPFAA